MRELIIPESDPITPGEILEEDYRKELGLTQQQLADALGISRTRYAEIVSGKRRVTVDTASRIARVLGTTPGFWLNIQHVVDMYELEHSAAGDAIKKLRPLKKSAIVPAAAKIPA